METTGSEVPAPAPEQPAAPAPAAPDDAAALAERVRALGEAFAADIVETRRLFHRHPEVAWDEHWTQRQLACELDKLGVPYAKAAGTGLVATVAGTAADAYDACGRPARRVALRADIDALPIAERTGAPFASECEGVMHACGHDCHMAMTLGAARILMRLREHLHGEVRILFQPAEEVANGSLSMIADGALEGVDAIYGAHVWSEVDAGRISCESGPRMANTDWFRIDVEGVSAHGAMPHKGVDAVVVGAQIVGALQTVVSRESPPFEPVVVTVGEFHGGQARNIVAGSAWMTGTVRTFSEESRRRVLRRVREVAEQTGALGGARVEFVHEPGNDVLVNDPACAEVARRAVCEVLGEQAVGSYEGTLSGEDFTEYLRLVPGVFVFVGVRNPDVGAVHPQHSCYYTVDESALPGGAMVAAQWALDMLRG